MGGTSMNGASGGAGSARVRHAFAGVVGMGGVGGCELVLAHCWVLEQQAPWPWGWGCCFWSPYLVKPAWWVGGWGVGCCLRTA